MLIDTNHTMLNYAPSHPPKVTNKLCRWIEQNFYAASFSRKTWERGCRLCLSRAFFQILFKNSVKILKPCMLNIQSYRQLLFLEYYSLQLPTLYEASVGVEKTSLPMQLAASKVISKRYSKGSSVARVFCFFAFLDFLFARSIICASFSSWLFSFMCSFC